MNRVTIAQDSKNLVPKGAIRLSKAFEVAFRAFTPDWESLSNACVQWDENEELCEVNTGEDPRRIELDAMHQTEVAIRNALLRGELHAYIHNVHTGIDLELDPREWLKYGNSIGITSDYTMPNDPITPGPDCSLNGVRHPAFLIQTEFEAWLILRKSQAPATVAVTIAYPDGEAPEADVAARSLLSKAYSIEDVIERTGLSKTVIYDAIKDGALVARKFRRRTMILATDLDLFLQMLPRM